MLLIRRSLLSASSLTTTSDIVKRLSTGLSASNATRISPNDIASSLDDTMPPTVLRHIRQREKGTRDQLVRADLQVIGVGADSAKCVALVSNIARYLFNCGEGTQRLLQEQKVRITRLEQLFFTQLGWSTLGGVPGMTLTLADASVPKLDMHGPPGVECLHSAVRPFMDRSHQLSSTCHSGEHTFKDDCVTIEAIPLVVEHHATAMAYLAQLHAKIGRLVIERCIDLGVPPGPLLGQLKAGKSVTLADGTVVEPEQVKEPDELGRAFLVVDCPTLDHVEALVEAPVLRDRVGSAHLPTLTIVVHMTPTEIAQSDVYCAWVSSLDESTQHWYIGNDHDVAANINPYRMQSHLSLLDNYIFPLLHRQRESSTKPSDEQPRQIGRQARKARPNDSYQLRPLLEFQEESDSLVNCEKFREEILVKEDFQSTLDRCRAVAGTPEVHSAYPNVIFLGTGSAIPNKSRNTSAILLQISSSSSLLLDCGEGTYGQMSRFFGVQELDEQLRKLKAVYISHHHADHHLGLINILLHRQRAERESERGEPLLLLAPDCIRAFLHVYDKDIERVSDTYRFVNNAVFLDEAAAGAATNGYLKCDAALAQSVADSIGLSSVRTCTVDHSAWPSFGIAVNGETTVDDGGTRSWKLVYSGDTKPCQSLIELGADCDLLMHEATMEDDLVEDARRKFHTTVSQAIEVGRVMNAKSTILTHFSQRYAKIPMFSDDDPLQPLVGVAFDNMQIRLLSNDCDRLAKFRPVLELMYSEEFERLRAKTLTRVKKRRIVNEAVGRSLPSSNDYLRDAE